MSGIEKTDREAGRKQKPSLQEVAERVAEAKRLYLSCPHTPVLRHIAAKVGLHADTVEKYAKQERWVEERALQPLATTPFALTKQDVEQSDASDLEAIRSVCKTYLLQHPQALSSKDGLAVVKLLLDVVKLSVALRSRGSGGGASPEDAITPAQLLSMIEENERVAIENLDTCESMPDSVS